jgi:hypothetical protein
VTSASTEATAALSPPPGSVNTSMPAGGTLGGVPSQADARNLACGTGRIDHPLQHGFDQRGALGGIEHPGQPTLAFRRGLDRDDRPGAHLTLSRVPPSAR